MDYNNVTYPLDKIYSQATGVSYPVTAASVAGGNTPSHGEFGELVFERFDDEETGGFYYSLHMQCTGPMDPENNLEFRFDNLSQWFNVVMYVDTEDNTKLVNPRVEPGEAISDLEVGDSSQTMNKAASSIYTRQGDLVEEGPLIDWVCVEGQ